MVIEFGIRLMRFSCKREEQPPSEHVKIRCGIQTAAIQKEVEKPSRLLTKTTPPYPENPKYLGINYPGEMWPAEQQV